MPSLTPISRTSEATNAAMNDGLFAGFLALIPSTFAVYRAMKNEKFLRSTNWQSRTALAIMPPLFVFGLTAEMTLSHTMHEMASESDHHRKVSEYAQKQVSSMTHKDDSDMNEKLHKLYQRSVEEAGVRIVPGNTLGIHHQAANFIQNHPFKILAGIGVPSVLYIFRGRTDQKHLQLQSKIMHTRVFGQFAVITMLLSLMGFKSLMDANGKFITQEEADARVEEMKRMRQELVEQIEFDKQLKVRREEMLKHNDLHHGKSEQLKTTVAVEDA